MFHATCVMSLGAGTNVGGAYVMWAAKRVESKERQNVCFEMKIFTSCVLNILMCIAKQKSRSYSFVSKL